jgi:hypothetical protein
MTHNQHPKGDQHWTRRMPSRVLRGPAANGAKLSQIQIELLCSAYYDLGARPAELAIMFKVSRQTVWRHLRARAILTEGVTRGTPQTEASAG